MKKKNYLKPTMEVVKLLHSSLICTISPGGEEGGYIPGMNQDDMNKLA